MIGSANARDLLLHSLPSVGIPLARSLLRDLSRNREVFFRSSLDACFLSSRRIFRLLWCDVKFCFRQD
jgi:hypothetical protein